MYDHSKIDHKIAPAMYMVDKVDDIKLNLHLY